MSYDKRLSFLQIVRNNAASPVQVVSDKACSNDFRNFLDTQQYNTNGILRYERIFGPGFVSTGGADTTKASKACNGLRS